LLQKIGFDQYEFSHLSLQEYLCANYLVREPITDNIYNYLSQYPAPLAISVTLSSHPSNWLSNILLFNRKWSEPIVKNISSLFDRIVHERTYFEESELLGVSLIKVLSYFSKYYSEILVDSFFNLLKSEGVKASLSLGLTYYKIINLQESEDIYTLKSLPDYLLLKKYEERIPLELSIRKGIIRKVISKTKLKISQNIFNEEGATFKKA